MVTRKENPLIGIEKRLSALESDSKQTLNTVTQLKLSICGSEKIGVEGMVTRVRKLESYVEGDKKKKWMLAGALSVLSFVISALVAYFKKAS